MSQITTLLVAVSAAYVSEPGVGELEQRLRDYQWRDEPDPTRPYLVEVAPGAWGGTRSPSCVLFVAALNHTPPEVILAAVADTRWERPGEAQILVMEEGDRYFTTYAFRQGSWQAFGPGEPDD